MFVHLCNKCALFVQPLHPHIPILAPRCMRLHSFNNCTQMCTQTHTHTRAKLYSHAPENNSRMWGGRSWASRQRQWKMWTFYIVSTCTAASASGSLSAGRGVSACLHTLSASCVIVCHALCEFYRQGVNFISTRSPTIVRKVLVCLACALVRMCGCNVAS